MNREQDYILKPMLATLVDEPPEGKRWLYEIKWDGYRCLAFCNKKQVELVSRNQKSFNEKYYSLYEELKKLHLEAVLDGEIVVIKDSGVSSFGALQNWRSEADGELIYYVFDILKYKNKNLIHQPLIERRNLLNTILKETESVRISKTFNAPLKEMLKAASKLGVEGIIAKNEASFYQPGARSDDWLKIKINKRHEVVIGGYTQNDHSPKPFSSLLVGVYEQGALKYIGKIGTGFSIKLQKELMLRFKPLIAAKCPFTIEPDIQQPSRFRPHPPHASVTWLKPELVCEVSYIEMTADGVMRHPSFEGMREDKNAVEVHAEIVQQTKNDSLKKAAAHKVEAKSLGARPRAGAICEESITPALLMTNKAHQKGEFKTLLNPKEKTQTKIIKGHELKFNNLQKIFWPKEGYTKRELLNYYYQVAPFILPYLKNRPQSLNRFPNGITGLSFYQKDVTHTAPAWIKQFPYRTNLGEDKNFLVVQDEADLLWMANLGAIEMNPWNSTIDTPDSPTWCSIDIDPTDQTPFEEVITTAQATKQVLDASKIPGYCKTSGSRGLHIYIPLANQYTYEQCQLFGRLIATQVHNLLPQITSIERYTVKREGKIYIDFLQNRPKATLAAPYSVRPKPGAPVSMPLHWDEVKKGLKPIHFTLQNTLARLKIEGDLFKPVLGKGVNLAKILKAMKSDLFQ